jgi:hypothetical protein
MNAAFAELVESIRLRSLEEKGELLHLLERDLREARRSELAANAAEARREHAEGLLSFSDSVAELKQRLF